jgi:5-formyltetrahydrofolate cyclo-ligase
MKRILADLPESYLEASAGKIEQNLLALPEYRDGGTLFCYCSMGREIETRGIILSAVSGGRAAALPKTFPGGQMIFRAVRGLDTLRPGVFGIMEPDESCPEIGPEDGDVCVVPGLCFDRDLHRLGLGGGYYDRWLAGSPAVKIGVCRDRLLAEAVPTGELDIDMDILVTESGVIRK